MIQMMQGHALTILSEMPRDYLFDAVIIPVGTGTNKRTDMITRYYQGGRCATPGFIQDVCAANFEMDSLRMYPKIMGGRKRH